MATMTLEIIAQAFFVLPERMKHALRKTKKQTNSDNADRGNDHKRHAAIYDRYCNGFQR